MTTTILFTIISLCALGIASAVILYIVAQKFKVEEDPRIDIVDKEVIYRSKIYFTPLRSATEIDAEEVKRIVREEYRRLTRTFKKPLTRLTVTQGKILVRLVYRETSNSAFEHIREYKGAVSACFWQGIALLFGNNLKADYEPEGRDREIEEIVRKVDSERK